MSGSILFDVLCTEQYLAVCYTRGDLQNKRSRSGLVSLMRALCFRLREDPTLVDVFFSPPQDNAAVIFCCLVCCCLVKSSFIQVFAVSVVSSLDQPEFLLFTALLTLLNSDHEDGHNAREGLLCCVQLPLESVSSFVVNHTLFCEQLVHV
jgi:hypothetical protein